MITLALDTTSAWCTSALVSSDKILSYKSERIGRGHAERLAPMVQEVLRAGNIAPAGIDRIAVCTGPGSFTGLRVALAFARALALPHNIPVLGLSALRVIAAQADPEGQLKVAATINAKRGEVCWTVYQQGREIFLPKTQSIEKTKAEIETLEVDVLVGDGAELVGIAAIGQAHVNGAVLGWLSQELRPASFPPVPLYMRGPDAKLPGGITP